MRVGEAYVSVVLRGDDESLAAKKTRVKPSESLEGGLTAGIFGGKTIPDRFSDAGDDGEEDSDENVSYGLCEMPDSDSYSDEGSSSPTGSDEGLPHPISQPLSPPRYGRGGRHGCGISFMRRG